MLVGIDVLDVVRMEKFVQNEHFLEKYFTPYEIGYVQHNNRQTLSLAGLYAAKEAFLKALGIGIGRGIDIKDICVKHDELGKPYYDIDGVEMRRKLDKYSIQNIDLSISHTGTVSTAICVIIQK